MIQEDPSLPESLGRGIGQALAWAAGLLGRLWDIVGGSVFSFFGGLLDGLGVKPENGFETAGLILAGLFALWGLMTLFTGNVFGAIVRLGLAAGIVALLF